MRSFLLRHGHAYTGRRWGPAHQLFVLKIKFEDPAQHIAFTEYRLAVHFRTECVERLEGALRKEVKSWRSLPVINALMTLRAIDFLSAITIVAELGDLRRFPHPRELMGYLGLVPSEHSSGPTQHRGDCVEGAGSVVCSFSSPACTRSSSQQSDRGDCPRTVRIYLGHRTASTGERYGIGGTQTPALANR